MVDILQQIKELENQIKSARDVLKTFKEEIGKLKTNSDTDRQTISTKENELKELRNELFKCNGNKEKIQQDLNDKVIELENSNLTKEEKQDQVIKLLTKNGFANACKELVEV